MAAKKIKPAKGKGVLKGKLPTKRSINLVLVDENKINPLTAILGILLIVVLAGVFSKFLVIDRLDAMAQAQGRVTRLQGDLDSAMDALDNIGDIGETYAHYTLEGMTAAELSRNCSVDKAFISRLTGELCTAGYVEYKTREISRHNNKLMLTETGRQVMSEIHQIINDSVSHIVSGIPENHLTIFYTVLNLITENLEAEAE